MPCSRRIESTNQIKSLQVLQTDRASQSKIERPNRRASHLELHFLVTPHARTHFAVLLLILLVVLLLVIVLLVLLVFSLVEEIALAPSSGITPSTKEKSTSGEVKKGQTKQSGV